MEFGLKSAAPATLKTGLIAVGVYEKGKLGPVAATLDKAAKGALERLVARGDFDGKVGCTLLLQDIKGIAAERVLLYGLGPAAELDALTLRKALIATAEAAGATGAKDATFSVNDLKNKVLDDYWLARHAVETIDWALYTYETTKSKKSKPRALKKIALLDSGTRRSAGKTRGSQSAIGDGLKHGKAIAHGVTFARDLANLPGNICTPTYLANEAKKLARNQKKLTVRILEEAEMKKLGMGSLLSVSRGSRQPAKLIAFQYAGGKKGDKPHALVGKGLTFDAGGISIKPGPGMDEMKFDMCGGASVFGAMRALVELDLPVNVVGVVPSSENLPDGDANKPGDIVTAMDGQTIEVLNTDAEGRLILCDALTWTDRTYEPKTVVDIATLTGACVIALGNHATGLLSNDDRIADTLLEAGRKTADRAWRLPLWSDYDEQLKSNFADMANIGGREAGTITAACFLHRFTKKMRWAHLDIAGTAYQTGAKKGATGRPVSLLVQYLLEQ